MVDALVRACMRTPQAARYIAISKSRLSQLRMTGEGPPFQDCSEARCLRKDRSLLVARELRALSPSH